MAGFSLRNEFLSSHRDMWRLPRGNNCHCSSTALRCFWRRAYTTAPPLFQGPETLRRQDLTFCIEQLSLSLYVPGMAELPHGRDTDESLPRQNLAHRK